VGLIIGYLAWVNFRIRREFFVFLTGVLVLLVALESPLDALGDTYLFSAHMLQHQLLILAVPPLLLLGIPAEARGEKALRQSGALRQPQIGQEPRVLNKLMAPARSMLPWLVGVGTVWAWHLPAFFDAALADERIHLVEHLSFLIASTIFWWPVLSPWKEQRLPLLARVAYLLLAAAACDILGTILAYSEPGLYPPYLKPEDVYGILPLLRERWRISASVDQQAGGLLMGITGDLVYLLVALSAMSAWYRARVEKNTS
jgi:putative membrane protein